MSAVIRLDCEVYAYVNEMAARLQFATGRPVSLNDAVAFSIGFYSLHLRSVRDA